MIHDLRTCDCYDCQVTYVRQEDEPTHPLEDAIRRYIRYLEDEGIPLTAQLTVAAVLDDLCDLGDIPKPLAVSTALLG